MTGGCHMNEKEYEDSYPVSKEIGNRTAACMRVVLAAQGGDMYSLSLPSVAEGRYYFSGNLMMGSKLPVYIEPEAGRWFVYIGKDVAFSREAAPGVRKAVLTAGKTIKLIYKHEQYIIYAEEECPGDRIFVPYCLDEAAWYVIGNGHECDICYENPYVSQRHARLTWHGDSWYIMDGDPEFNKGSTNGTYVNGHRAESLSMKKLHNGDSVYIMGLLIHMGIGFITMNNANNRVTITTEKIRRISDFSVLEYAPSPEECPVNPLFDRHPRKRMQLDPDPIDIELPPMALSKNKVPLLLRLGNPLVMGGRALMTGNVLMSLTSMVFPSLTQGLTEKEQKEYEARRQEAYTKYLQEKEKEINKEKAYEEQALNDLYPPLEEALLFSKNKLRLWERQKNDEDFLSVRIGSGRLPMVAEINYSDKRFSIERDELIDKMYELAERHVYLDDAPIMISLRNDRIIGVQGDKGAGIAVLRNILMQIALTHSYDECKIVLLIEPENACEFEFARYLPNLWDNDRSIRFLVTGKDDALQVSQYLSSEFSWLTDEPDATKKKPGINKPEYVILAQSKDLFECFELFKEALTKEAYPDMSFITAYQGIPKECRKIIYAYDEGIKDSYVIDLMDPKAKDQKFTLDTFNHSAARNSLAEMMRTKLMTGAHDFSFPGMISFMELFKAGKVEHLNPQMRWAENNPVKSLAAPIGLGSDGRIFTLDLHEKYQGPHGLVAGMTGSGKSEFLITYILSMAVNYSPDEVAFILIDYKGGGLADAFEDKEMGIHLPHLVGTITNLDGSSIQRSLMSIKSELLRRQKIFKKAKSEMHEGTMDIYDYQKFYRNKKVSEPLPHLFIISDEFAELKQQQPEFMDELISAARIGRSLGVHLVLATQKPGGVVNNQIWSNTKFRACLRVQDREDSMEMLKRPEAAELKNTGRFYLQVGYNEYFAMGQAAWCGADYIPSEEVVEEKDNSIQFLDNTGNTVIKVKPSVNETSAQCRQIVAIVRYLSDLADREGIKPRSLWTTPLPSKIDLDELLEDNPVDDKDSIIATVGVVDDPELQKQYPFHVNFSDLHNVLLVGSAGSGKSTFVKTLLYSLVCRYSPEKLNFYLVDFSNGALAGFKNLPHCGAYLTEKEDTELSRLMKLIRDITEERKKLIAAEDGISFNAYNRLHPIPMIVVVIDNYMNIKNLNGGSDMFMQFKNYLQEGNSVGIHYVLTCNHSNEPGPGSKMELDYRITLQAKDKYDYGDILETRCKYIPPEINGRGMCLQNGRPLEYHTAMLDCNQPDEIRREKQKNKIAELSKKYASEQTAKKLNVADLDEPYTDFCNRFMKGRIPLGYSKQDMKLVSIPFQQLFCTSVYFGNKKAPFPVWHNLMDAADYNSMDVIALRRRTDSLFEGESAISRKSNCDIDFYESTSDGISAMVDTVINRVIVQQNALRDEYCKINNIPATASGRVLKASKYIRERSKPVMVILESFSDLCRAELSDEVNKKLMTVFESARGYNLYFFAGFYWDDDKQISVSPLAKVYNKESFTLLLGGRCDKYVIPSLSYEITKITQPISRTDTVIMKYRDGYHTLLVPGNSTLQKSEDPDDEPII